MKIVVKWSNFLVLSWLKNVGETNCRENDFDDEEIAAFADIREEEHQSGNFSDLLSQIWAS